MSETIFCFLDESGSDNLSSSKTLVAVLVVVKDIHQVDICLTTKKKLHDDVKKVFEETCGEFKFNVLIKHAKKSMVKKYLDETLKKIIKLDIDIYINVVTTLVDKFATQRAKNNIIVDYCSLNFDKVYNNKVEIFADKEFYKPAFDILFLGIEKQFKTQKIGITTDFAKIEKQLEGYDYKILTIKHMDSRQSKGLQLADLICGSLFQKFERDNNEYYDIIKERIKRIEENV